MSELVAVEWGREQVACISAQIAAGSVRIGRCAVWPKPEGLDSAEPREAGVWLKAQLAQLQMSGNSVVLVLPREAVVVKRLQLPNAPDEELPQLVRFQAGAKSGLALDEMSLDFLSIPRAANTDGRQVLAAVVSRKLIERFHSLCQAADLKLAAVRFSPCTVLELVCRSAAFRQGDSQGGSLVVVVQGERVEVSIAEGPTLLFSHSFRVMDETSVDQPKRIFAEVNRALIAFNSETPVRHVWLIAEAGVRGELATLLGERFHCAPTLLDPFAEATWEGGPTRPQFAETFAGLVGALYSESGSLTPEIDFLNPRRSIPKRDNRKLRIALYSGLAGTVALVLVGLYILSLRQMDGTIARFAKVDQELSQMLKQGEPLLKSSALVQEWLDGETNWLDEMLELTQHMPSTERIYLSSLHFDPQGAPYLAKIKAEGFARERDDVMSLNQRSIADQERHELLPNAISPEKGNIFYPWRFESEMLVKKPQAKSLAKGDAKVAKEPAGSAAKPAAEKPLAEKPTVEKSEAGKPAVAGPPATVPPAAKPESEKPATEKPGLEKTSTPAGLNDGDGADDFGDES